jgi:sulfur-oxidizing protein SoxY
MKLLNRRDALKLGGVAIAALAVAPAQARPEAEALVKEFASGKAVQEAGLVLDIPELSENANAVPVGIRIDDKFSEGRYCEEILLIAENNPRPMACRFRFSSQTGMANIVTRIRLAESQTVIALARMSDGAILAQRTTVTVTVGGCNG